jgi:hypothetical protein
MGCHRLGAGLGVALLLGALPGVPASRAAAQSTAPSGLAVRTVHGKLEMVNESVNGVAVVSDEGQRVAWQFDKTVIEKIKGFKPGDPVVVIYRERGADKAVTAIAFPGKAATPVYVNTSGQRVELVSGPMVGGACGQPADAPVNRTTIPTGGRAETADACWCCAPAGQACVPSNRTGLGQAFLIHCYE